jgi:hypothetical protein
VRERGGEGRVKRGEEGGDGEEGTGKVCREGKQKEDVHTSTERKKE